MIKAVVGAGGKTSWIKQQAKEYVSQGYKVFVTTSTHMFIEEDTVLTDDPRSIIHCLYENGYVMAGLVSGDKISALSPETYQAVCSHADIVLVEADGSKHMPIKYPSHTEPVIPENADEIFVVCGLHALGKRACEVSHRLELVKECLGISDDTIITEEHVEVLVREGYVRPLRERFPKKKIMVYPNHNGSAEQMLIAQKLKKL